MTSNSVYIAQNAPNNEQWYKYKLIQLVVIQLCDPAITDQSWRAIDVEICNTIVVFSTSWKWRHLVIKKTYIPLP